MARIERIEHFLSEDEWKVTKEDGYSMRRIFDNRDDAEVYRHYLEQIETQERIASNQEKVVNQNQQIIDNQNRLIRNQEQRPSRPPLPQVTRQVLDPEYKEWLQFQKETNPEYKKWKKEKEAEESRKKAERDAEIKRQEAKKAEEAAIIKAKQEKEEARRRNEIRLNQEKIAPLELDFLDRKKLTWEQRVQIAKYTENGKIINKLKFDNSKKVLEALLLNPFITGDVTSTIYKRQQVAAENREFRKKIEQESKGGCLGIVLMLVASSIATCLCIFI